MHRLVLTSLAVIAVCGSFRLLAAPDAVRVVGGIVAGEPLAGGIVAYKGIPYAAAPVGDLRWKPPQPVVAWPGERAATEFGASCPQSSRLGDPGKTSEDCLFLNVWAPATAKDAPVMVWIHGGSNRNGSGSGYEGQAFARNGIVSGYDGRAFAKDGIVMVTINYRLGPLGFFAHPALTTAAGPAEPLANYGLMDQTAALQWVQANIAQFGGDPKNVTVFGESAGALDIYALLGLKSAKGLFRRAIIQSNIGWGDRPLLAKAEEDGTALAARAGAPDAATPADLRAIPADTLVAAERARPQGLVVDGRFMTETALQAVANGHVVDVPLIIGSNSFEASQIAQTETDVKARTDWTNAQAGAPARFIAAKTAKGEPSWLYFFSYVAEGVRASSPGAAHGSEIFYVFGGMHRRPASAPALTAADQAMASLMHSCWVAFAKTGQPTCASGPAWPKYDARQDQLMEFGAPSGVRTKFRKVELDRATAAVPGAR